MVLEQRQQDFIQYLRFEKRYAAPTISAYSKDLSQFIAFVSSQFGICDPGELTHYHLRSWLAGLRDAQQTPRTINRKISSLSSFFVYLMKQQVLTRNPVRQLHTLRVPERLPAYLKERETQYLLEELTFGEGFRGFTDRMICELLYQTGMRRNELKELKESDIEWGMNQIRIMGKGSKERLVPVGGELLEELRRYISEKSSIDFADRDHLLVLESGKPLYAGYIYRVVRKYLSMATTQKKKSPHVLRHSFATHLLNNGANIQAIKDLLGHSSLATTQIYAHNQIDKLKEIHKLNHPRG